MKRIAPYMLYGIFFFLLQSQTGYSQSKGDDLYMPDFMSLEDFQNQVLTAKDEVWVVDFWASWCGPCIQSVPHMKEMHAAYADKGVRFVSVSWDRKKTQWFAALERLQMPWNHLIVPQGQEAFLEENFPHKGIPTVFVVDKSGNAKKVRDLYKLDRMLDKALEE